MTRKYELKKRAEKQEETRQRIVYAAIELHETVGPARTTISAIAERAGVERLTVYRHFPDERAIFGACSSQWELQHPLPDPAEWSSIPDPHERLRTGLGALYDYYQDAWPMLFSVLRDAPQVPEMSEVVQDYAQRAQRIVDSLSPSPSPDDEQRAAIQMAADPFAWNALSRSGLSTDRAAALMTRMIVRGSAEESPRN